MHPCSMRMKSSSKYMNQIYRCTQHGSRKVSIYSAPALLRQADMLMIRLKQESTSGVVAEETGHSLATLLLANRNEFGLFFFAQITASHPTYRTPFILALPKRSVCQGGSVPPMHANRRDLSVEGVEGGLHDVARYMRWNTNTGRRATGGVHGYSVKGFHLLIDGISMCAWGSALSSTCRKVNGKVSYLPDPFNEAK